MNSKLTKWVVVAGLGCASVSLLLAQQLIGTGTSVKLSDAVQLIDQKKYAEAKQLITAIAPGDAEYAAAQCYKLICLYELKDHVGYLTNYDAALVNSAPVSAALKEGINYRQAQVLFQCRRFDQLLAQANQFEAAYPNSTRRAAVAELGKATLFERGMKKTLEACQSQDPAVFQKRWQEGKANLEAFVAATRNASAYVTLTNRSLREEVWRARLTLGEEQAVLAETADATDRERVLFLRVQLFAKLQPEKPEQNLQRMKDYLREFPNAKQARRVQFDAASLSYQLGKQLMQAAAEAEVAGDLKGGQSKRTQARRHFETLRAAQAVAIEDRSNGIAATDVRDLHEDTLCSYALDQDYATVSERASVLVANASPGQIEWLMGKEYQAIVQLHQDPAAAERVAAQFDELLKLGFNGQTENDRLMLTAAQWRATLALRASDLAAVRRVIEQVRQGPCVKNFKEQFLNEYARYIPETKL
jgi:hypothetical protein